MNPSPHFPRLALDNHRDTSLESHRYNCIAWATEDVEHWWQPGIYWLPADSPMNDFGLGALEKIFLLMGYVDCGMDESLEPGFTKVALYGNALLYTHAARQIPNGKWTSKLGKGVDIEHDDPEVVAGGLYGDVAQIMKRPNANQKR